MSEAYDPARAGSALAEAVTCAFGDMTFLDAEPLPSGRAADLPDSLPEETRAIIDLLRPASARLELRIPSELRARMLEILYSGGEEGGGEERDDSILELLNVIAGQFVTRYFGRGGDVKLELPRYLYFHEDFEGDAVLDLAFDAEGSPFRVILSSIRYRY